MSERGQLLDILLLKAVQHGVRLLGIARLGPDLLVEPFESVRLELEGLDLEVAPGHGSVLALLLGHLAVSLLEVRLHPRLHGAKLLVLSVDVSLRLVEVDHGVLLVKRSMPLGRSLPFMLDPVRERGASMLLYDPGRAWLARNGPQLLDPQLVDLLSN